MKKERIVELSVLILIFLFVITSVMVFNHYKFEKPNTYNIVFKDIDSIVKGSPVRFMGINVGHVVKLRRKDGYIICKIRITKEGVKIPDMTRAKVAFNGLGGSKSVELFPPLTNEPDIKGIIADESLRINDFAAVVKDLKDVCIFINNFVQELDPVLLMNSVKEFTNPEIIDRVDNDVDKIIQMQNDTRENVKMAAEKENAFVEFLEWVENLFKGSKKNQE